LQSVSTSTRTFQTPPTTVETPAPKAQRALPKLPKMPAITGIKLSANRLPWAIVAVFAVISLFLLAQYNDAKAKLVSPQASVAAAKQVSDTLGKVAKLAIVPANETPTVATVANAAKLKGQSFFANAKDGDKVIVYSQAKEAILYRPSTNQIVTIAPVTAPAATQ
jgi:hypothetical protein